MKKVLLNFLLLFFLMYVSIIVDAQVTWEKTIGGTNYDDATGIIQTSDGGFAFTGRTRSYGAGGTDVYVGRLDRNGVLLWTKTIGGSSDDGGMSIIQTMDKGFAVAGYTWSYGAGEVDAYVVKLDSSGNVKWTKTIGYLYKDYGSSIIQTKDKGYMVVGAAENLRDRAYVVKLDSNGNLQWTRGYGHIDDDFYSIAKCFDGGYAIAGYTTTFTAGQNVENIYVLKLDSNWNVLWSTSVGGSAPDTTFDGAYSIIQSSDSTLVAVGYTNSFGNGGPYDYYVVKLSKTGSILWKLAIGGIGNDMAKSVVQTKDKGYLIAGFTNSFGAGGYDIYLVKLNSLGQIAWTKAIGRSGDDLGYSLVQDKDGGYVVAGSSRSFGNDSVRIYLVKVDSLGNTCSASAGGGTLSSGGNSWTGAVQISFGSQDSGGIFGSGGTLSQVCSNCTLNVNVAVVQNLVCFGGNDGAASSNVAGGMGAYTYLWSNNATTSSVNNLTAGTYTVTVTDSIGCTAVASVAITQPPPKMRDSISVQINNRCYGGNSGSLTVGIKGGALPYTYSWSNGDTTPTITGLPAGTYTVIVTDSGGCIVSVSTNITQPPPLVLSLTYHPPLCHGSCDGTITPRASGGTPPYTYSGSISNLCAGPYTITVTDSCGNTATATTTIADPPQLMATNIITNITPCYGDTNGSAIVNITGGTSPYSYLWIPTGSTSSEDKNLKAGIYVCKVTDNNGCILYDTVTIAQPALLTDIISASPDTICGNGCTTINVNAIGGTPAYYYSWSNGSTTSSIHPCPDSAAVYYVHIRDANFCSISDSIKVWVDRFIVTSSSQFPTICLNATTDSLYGAPAGGTFSGAGVSGNIFNPSIAGVGTHWVVYTYTDSIGCTAKDSISVRVNSCTGVPEVNNLDNQIMFYPNPFSAFVNVDVGTDGPVTFTMFNILGEIIGIYTLDKGLNTITTKTYPSGLYFIRVKTKDGVLNKKLIKVN